MRKTLYLFFLSSIPLFSQFSINNSLDNTILSFDSQGNNPTSNTMDFIYQKDDFVILPNGNVGLGIINPNYKLDIRLNELSSDSFSALRLPDGTHGFAKYLKSDENGVANWGIYEADVILGYVGELQNGTNITMKTGNETTVTGNGAVNHRKETGGYIDLPPGKWEIDLKIVLETAEDCYLTSDDYIWVKSTFSSNGTYSEYSRRRISGLYRGPKPSGKIKSSYISGTMQVENETNVIRRYKHFIVDTNVYLTNQNDVNKCNQLKNVGKVDPSSYIIATRISND